MAPVEFSVLIPTRDRAESVELAVRSALEQSRPPCQVIVVDDCSTDDTVERLRRWSVEVLRGAGRGPGAARNLAARHARAEYLIFLDSDDLLLSWAVERLAEAVERYGRPAIVMSRPYRFEERAELEDLTPEPANAHCWRDYLAAAPARKPVTIAAAVRRDLFRGAGGFAEAAIGSEDQDLFLRLGQAPGFVFVEEPTLYAAAADGGLSRDPDRLYAGVRSLLANEAAGRYPGGRARRAEREVVLARNLRYAVSRLVGAGRTGLAYDLLRRGGAILWRAGYGRELPELALKPLRVRPGVRG